MEFSLSMEKEILSGKNVASFLSAEEKGYIGGQVKANFDADRMSRSQWEEKMEAASKIALQVKETKTFPWPGASNVKFPLLTIAALQFHSRAYPAMIAAPNIVRVGTVGGDERGEKSKIAKAISDHMNWQLTEEDEAWEEQHDKAFLVLAIMGCVFMKSYFSKKARHNVTELVLPQDFVVSYYTKSLAECPRATHIQTWFSNKFVEGERQGTLEKTELEYGGTPMIPFGKLQEVQDQSQGMTPAANDSETPYTVLEQACYWDLDGDGYKEPYICIVRYDTAEVLSVKPNFFPSGVKRNEKGEIYCIEPEKHFTKLSFITSPDGGFYDLGFGHLLGPLNESIDTAINQLFDAGTMHNAGGGFLGRGARIRGGSVAIKPNEWVRVDSSGDDLRKSIVELPMREPSAVLFNLLSLLIDYGQRVAGAPDIVQGQNPGQNTPAETSRNMMEQGMKIFSGIYKRVYRGLKDEFRILYRLNSIFMEETEEYSSPLTGLDMKVLSDYYRYPSSFVRPAADPNYLSEGQRMNQALGLVEAAKAFPGYDIHEVNMYYLDALHICSPEKYHPDPKGPNAIQQAPDVKLQIAQMDLEFRDKELMLEMQVRAAELINETQKTQAEIRNLEADMALKLAQATDAADNAEIVRLQTALAAAKLKQEGDARALDVLQSLMKLRQEAALGKADFAIRKQELSARKEKSSDK